MWIRNTLDVEELECSVMYLDEAREREDLEILIEPRPLPIGPARHVARSQIIGTGNGLKLTASRIHKALKEQGITHVVGLPDNLSRVFFRGLEEDPDLEVIMVCREGEAFAIAAGLYIGESGRLCSFRIRASWRPGDALRGTTWNMKIPQVILLCYRGFKSLNGELEHIDSAALFTEPTLEAWDIPYEIICHRRRPCQAP